MNIVWDKLKKSFIDSLNTAIEKSEELTRVGRLKLEILQVEHRLEEKFTQLGRHLYENFPERIADLKNDPVVARLREEIQELEKLLNEKELELAKIKKEEGINFDS